MLANVTFLKSSLFNQSHFFETTIKVSVLNILSFTMNCFVYACMERERGYVPKYTVALLQRGGIIKINFLST